MMDLSHHLANAAEVQDVLSFPSVVIESHFSMTSTWGEALSPTSVVGSNAFHTKCLHTAGAPHPEHTPLSRCYPSPHVFIFTSLVITFSIDVIFLCPKPSSALLTRVGTTLWALDETDMESVRPDEQAAWLG